MKATAYNKSQLVTKAYELYANDVLSVFLQYNICMDDAEDLMQNVFLRILGVDTIHEDFLKGLVMVVAFNMRSDYFRKKIFRRRVLENMQIDTIDYHSNESEVVANDILRIERSIAQNCLNEVNAKVYCLSRYDEKSSAEIADELGLELRGVESRLYYTRKVMRKKLACAL